MLMPGVLVDMQMLGVLVHTPEVLVAMLVHVLGV